MSTHGIRGIAHSGGGTIQEVLLAAYTGPAAVSTTLVPSPGPGGLVTTTFDADGPVADYNSLTRMVRWGLPATFLLGVGACALAYGLHGWWTDAASARSRARAHRLHRGS